MNVTIARDGTTLGEWTEAEVRRYFYEGRLVATDHYWKPGMSSWFPLNVLMTQTPPLPPRQPGLPPVPALPSPATPVGNVQQEGKKEVVIVEERSMGAVCDLMIKRLSAYTGKGYKGLNAVALVDGYLNQYWLQRGDEKVLLEFDLRRSLPYMKNTFGFTVASLIFTEPNAKKTLKRMGLV